MEERNMFLYFFSMFAAKSFSYSDESTNMITFITLFITFSFFTMNEYVSSPTLTLCSEFKLLLLEILSLLKS